MVDDGRGVTGQASDPDPKAAVGDADGVREQPEVLYLFSSNTRPLYVQDILDALAAPKGTRHSFRYEEKIVSPRVRDTNLDGRPALLIFSIQQEARYHAPAFIPIRRAEVLNASMKAGIFVVEFKVADYVALKGTIGPGVKAEEVAAAIRNYTSALGSAAVDRPYDVSVSLGSDLAAAPDGPFEPSPGQAAAFRATATALQRTDWFRDARFVRFLRIQSEAGKGHDLSLTDAGYVLEAGQTYQLELAHYQPADVNAPDPFVVSADGDIVQVIGRAGFDIASPYDLVHLPIHATLPARDEARETVLAIQPGPEIQGPHIRLRIRVKPPKGRAAAMTVASAALLILFGLPALFTSMPQMLKFVCVALGAIALSWLQSFGWSIAIPGGLGYSAKPASNGTAKTD